MRAAGKGRSEVLDDLKAKLEMELRRFRDKAAKSKDAEKLITDKQRELNGEYQAEYDRVTALIAARLHAVIREWLSGYGKGVTVVVPAHTLLGY